MTGARRVVGSPAMPPRNPPDVRFASAPDGARIAYQVVGEGPRDLVLSTDWVSSIDLMWEEPRMERYIARLAGHGRLILFDKRDRGAGQEVAWRLDRQPRRQTAGLAAAVVVDEAGTCP